MLAIGAEGLHDGPGVVDSCEKISAGARWPAAQRLAPTGARSATTPPHEPSQRRGVGV